MSSSILDYNTASQLLFPLVTLTSTGKVIEIKSVLRIRVVGYIMKVWAPSEFTVDGLTDVSMNIKEANLWIITVYMN